MTFVLVCPMVSSIAECEHIDDLGDGERWCGKIINSELHFRGESVLCHCLSGDALY